MMPDSRINSWESWFIFNLWKININQYCNWTRGYKIIIVAYRQHITETHGNFLHEGNHTIFILYILERPSSWRILQIHVRPSWPRSSVRLSLLLVLFPKYISCLLWPTQYLAVCSNGSCFTLNPFLADCRLNTNVQVNNMTVSHHIYMDAHIYITSILLFILFFILLPLFPLAGRLARNLPVWHTDCTVFSH
jgi:hypothetical protein